MQRPRGINWTAALMLSCILIGIVHSVFVPLRPLDVARVYPHPLASATVFLLTRILPYTFAVFDCACIWAYWSGVEWARILVLIDCVLEIIALHRLPAQWHRYPSMAVLETGKACLAIFLLWYLFQPHVRAWFKGHTTARSPDARGTPATHAPPAASADPRRSEP